MYKFEVGKCYCATGVMKEARKRFVICIGREGSKVCFGFCDAFVCADPEPICGLDREFAQFWAPDAPYQYNVSSALPLDSETTARIIESMEGLRV